MEYNKDFINWLKENHYWKYKKYFNIKRHYNPSIRNCKMQHYYLEWKDQNGK